MEGRLHHSDESHLLTGKTNWDPVFISHDLSCFLIHLPHLTFIEKVMSSPDLSRPTVSEISSSTNQSISMAVARFPNHYKIHEIVW